MITFVQVGKCWLNTAQIRAVWVDEGADGALTCKVEFDSQHVLTYHGDDAKALRGYLQYHMTTPLNEPSKLPM